MDAKYDENMAKMETEFRNKNIVIKQHEDKAVTEIKLQISGVSKTLRLI